MQPHNDSKQFEPALIICASPESVAHAAVGIIEKVLVSKPNASLVFPTGNTPLPLYQRLRQSPNINWERARLFQLDEYVEPTPWEGALPYETFADFLYRNLWSAIGGQKFYLKKYFDCPAVYEELVTQEQGPDLIILGIGKNGHIAFNEPGTPKDSSTQRIQLAPDTIQRNFGQLNQPGFPTEAITLGLTAILKAKQILLLATGMDKQSITQQAFSPNLPPTADCPASWLKTHPNVTVLTDFPLTFAVKD